MGLFGNRKAKKLAKKQAEAALIQKKEDEFRAKIEAQAVQDEPFILEPQPEPLIETPVKKEVVVEKNTQAPTAAVKKEAVVQKKTPTPVPATPVKKETVVEKKTPTPIPTEDKKEAKPAKYHVSQNKDPKSDNHRNWRVRKEGSDKTIKFFSTQKDAIEYADSLAETAGSSVVIHKLDGSIRKQSYTKKT